MIPTPRWLWSLCWVLLAPAAWAHGGQPQARRLDFAPQFPNTVFAVTDNQGLYIGGAEGGFRWLCEDAVAPQAGLRWVLPMGEGQTRWLVSTDEALVLTTDRGCGFEAPLPAPFAGNRGAAASRHPDDPAELLVATDGFNGPNDVWRSVDAGETWAAANLAVVGRILGLVRSEADPTVVYVAHVGGAARSEDGGQSFTPIKLGPAEADVQPEEFVLLGAPAGDRDRVFAAVERLGGTLLMRSVDGGQVWQVVQVIDDFPLGLAFDSAGARGRLTGPFTGLWRSEDAGETWRNTPSPARLGCLRREPGTDRLWGCTNVFFGGPWAVGFSDDLGETWTPALRGWPEVVGRWPCVRTAPTRACCQHLCPGLAAGGQCADQAPAPGPSCEDVLWADAGLDQGAAAEMGVADGGVSDASVRDAGAADAGALDAHQPEAVDAGSAQVPDKLNDNGGCGHGGAGRLPWPMWLVLLALGRARWSTAQR